MKPLEKIVNYVRIAPHGIVPTAIAAGLVIDRVLNLGLYESLPLALKILDTSAIIFIAGFNVPFVFGGVKKYIKFKDFVEEHGVDKGHVEPNLRWYCERQAYKAAAYSCGLGQEFDEINKKYEGKKYYPGVPEI
jgi:hypothetical protein